MRPLLFLLSASLLVAGDWSKTFQVGTAPVLDVRCGDANVDVRAGSSGRIEARLTTKGWEIRPGEVEVIERQQGDRVELEVRVPEMRRWNWQGDRSIRLEVTMPATGRLHVNTGDGNVTASGVGGEVQIETGDGNIIADSLTGRVDANTGDGNVRLSGRFDALTIHTGDGNVELTAASGSSAAGPWRIQTGDGNVRLRVPDDMRIDLDASTGDGHVTSDLPLSVGPGKIGGNQMRGRLNGGGPVFTIRTNDGNIHLASAR